ncbi:MAG: BON domain-containing protein [Thiohalobacteraceae bacterium]
MEMFKPSVLIAFLLAAMLSLGGCAGDGAAKSTGDYIDDSAITAKVKSQMLADKTVSGLKINVDTFKGTVQLSGFVDSEAEARRAVEIAQGVKGVKSVQNDLVVRQ